MYFLRRFYDDYVQKILKMKKFLQIFTNLDILLQIYNRNFEISIKKIKKCQSILEKGQNFDENERIFRKFQNFCQFGPNIANISGIFQYFCTFSCIFGLFSEFFKIFIFSKNSHYINLFLMDMIKSGKITKSKNK